MLIGAIADEFSGANDLANTWARSGMRTSQYLGIPLFRAPAEDEAVVVALPLRYAQPADAVRLALEALAWLKEQGAQQIYFKYGSTFDSTPKGNIGPVMDALVEALNVPKTIACPALPEAGRTLYQGHLFVGGKLLSESGMESHPLTPMTDPDIRRLLRRQSRSTVGHISHANVRQGPVALLKAIDSAPDRILIVDAITPEDVAAIAAAVKGHGLVTGECAVAAGLPANFGFKTRPRARFEGVQGPALVLAGSCSTATRAQVARYAKSRPSMVIEPDAVMAGTFNLAKVLDFIQHTGDHAPIIYSTVDPIIAATAQNKYGRRNLSIALDGTFAAIARGAVADGVRRLVVAGGDTSAAVAHTFGTIGITVGPEIEHGVPALRTRAEKPVGLAFKSGNFGGRDFFERALAVLSGAVLP